MYYWKKKKKTKTEVLKKKNRCTVLLIYQSASVCSSRALLRQSFHEWERKTFQTLGKRTWPKKQWLPGGLMRVVMRKMKTKRSTPHSPAVQMMKRRKEQFRRGRRYSRWNDTKISVLGLKWKQIVQKKTSKKTASADKLEAEHSAEEIAQKRT